MRSSFQYEYYVGQSTPPEKLQIVAWKEEF